MKNALLVYNEDQHTYNIGDYVQSLAAEQYFPCIDLYLNREKLAGYNGESAKLIMNGWFTHQPDNWAPSRSINPLFISFHINSSASVRMLSSEGVAYLRRNAPIGCRDWATVRLLKAKGVDAYFSGCLTLTIKRPKNISPEGKIVIVDPFFDYPSAKQVFASTRTALRGFIKGDVFSLMKRRRTLEKIFSPELISSAENITHIYSAGTQSHDEKFDAARRLLVKYANARLVITSRIHCALPCLAMGVPVIFLNSFTRPIDTCRFEGIIDLFNRVDVTADGDISNNFKHVGMIGTDINIVNPDRHHELAVKLREAATRFVQA